MNNENNIKFNKEEIAFISTDNFIDTNKLCINLSNFEKEYASLIKASLPNLSKSHIWKILKDNKRVKIYALDSKLLNLI